MAKGPTLVDLAQAAGVGVATVDRVINARAPVREETRQKVFKAARALGHSFAGRVQQATSGALPRIKIGFVFSKERQAFYQSLRLKVEAAAADAVGAMVETTFYFSPSQAPSDFASLIREAGAVSDVVVATAVDHASVTDAVAELRAGGVETIALMNDFAQGVRAMYFGLNNLKSGRISAQLLSWSLTRQGKVAVFVGGHRWHGHALRETGFRAYMREKRPDIHVLDAMVNLETRQLTYEATLDLLARHPDLTGLYCAGGGMEGALAALREMCTPGQVALVVNELTTESRNGLADGYCTVVMGTPVENMCRELIAAIVARSSSPTTQLQGQVFVEPDIFISESL